MTGDDRLEYWDDAPDAVGFIGRSEELALLQHWVQDERCRLIALLGMGGIGKTSMAAKLAQTIAPDFERVFWQSLRNAPPVTDWLASAIAFLSDEPPVVQVSETEQITALLRLLRTRRCLLVLDNAETLFEPGQREGSYRLRMEGYGRLLQTVGETTHQSCLVLTSREEPPELALVGRGVRELELRGLCDAEARVMLEDKQLTGEPEAWTSLVERYCGNGLALKIVGETIRQVFDGDIAAFLSVPNDIDGTLHSGVRRLIDAQFERLSPLEQDVLIRLATKSQPISLAELALDMAPRVGRTSVLEAIETLRRRSLVKPGERQASFTLAPMVLAYVTDRLLRTPAEAVGAPRAVA